MNFQPLLAEKVMAGTKTVTRRLANENARSPWWRGGCALTVGRDYAVCPGRGKPAIGRVRIVAVDLQPLGMLSDDEARREGFTDAHEFEMAFADINGGDYSPRRLVWRVEFEVLRPAVEETA